MEETVVEKTFCKNCGKETDAKDYCNRACYLEYLHSHGHKGKSQSLSSLSNVTRCYRCGKVLPADWLSAYCTACENRWEE